MLRPGLPALEKTIRRQVRKELRASDRLWGEYKRARKSRSSKIPGLLVGGGVLMLAILRVWVSIHDNILVSIVMAGYTTGSAFLLAWILLENLHESIDLVIFGSLPVSDEKFFQLQWRKTIQVSIWVLCVSCLFYGYFALRQGFSATGWIASLGFAFLQWVVVLSAVVILAIFHREWLLFIIGCVLIGSSVAVFVSWEFIVVYLERKSWVDGFQNLTLLTGPVGWLMYAFDLSIIRGKIIASVLVLLSIVFAVCLPFTLRRMQGRFSIGEVIPILSTAETDLEDVLDKRISVQRRDYPLLESMSEMEEYARHEIRRAIPEVAERKIRSAHFLRGIEWEHMRLIERLVGRCLSKRERVVAEFMLGGNAFWTIRWKLAMVISATGLVLTFVVPSSLIWIVFLLLAVGTLMGLPLFGGSWPGFWKVHGYATMFPIYAGAPAGFWEISRVVLKSSFIRCAVWLPAAIIYTSVLGWKLGFNLLDGAILAVQIIYLIIVMQPALVAFRFSEGTNDTEINLRSLHRVFIILVVIALSLMGYISGFCLFFIPLILPSLVGAIILMASSVGILLLYGVWYNRGQIDLVRLSPSSIALS